MRLRGVLGVGFGGALLGVLLALPAQASMMWSAGDEVCGDPNATACTYSIDHRQSGQTGNWGTVELAKIAGGVEVSVDVSGCCALISAGNGTGDAFMFDLDKTITAANVTILTKGPGNTDIYKFETLSGNQSTGTWSYGIECLHNGQKCNGASDKTHTKLVFDITGISLKDFIANNKGNAFALDMCFDIATNNKGAKVCGGNTGDALVSLKDTQRVPEPVSLSLFGVGLVAMGAARRRRKNATAT